VQKPEDVIRQRVGRRSIVLVGLMGRARARWAEARVPPRPALQGRRPGIEIAANRTIADIFAIYGEPYFRSGDQRVIADGPLVPVTGVAMLARLMVPPRRTPSSPQLS
jgi:shikimate kinase